MDALSFLCRVIYNLINFHFFFFIFFLELGDNYAPICGAAKMACYNRAEDDLLKQDFMEGLTKTEKKKKGCNCLPACTSVTYDAEISQASFDWKSLFIAYKNPLDEFPG